MNPADKELIRKYIVGGASVGGGAALVTSLLNHLSTLEAERESEEKDYRSKLFADAVLQTRRTKAASVRGGLALTAGLGSTMLSYALVKELYRELKKKRLRSELEDSKSEYVGLLNKAAAAKGQPMSPMETLASIPVALPILLAIGSGVFANYALDEHFPTRKKKHRGLRPSDRYRLGGEEDEEEEYPYKEASAVPEMDLRLVGLLALAVNGKKASCLADMVGAVLDGSEAQFTEAFATNPLEAMDAIKGAGALLEGRTEAELAFALGLLGDNPLVKSSAYVMAAAEFSDAFPRYTELARNVDPEVGAKLAEVASAVSKSLLESEASGMDDGAGLEGLEGAAKEHTGLMKGLNTLDSAPSVSEDTSSDAD